MKFLAFFCLILAPQIAFPSQDRLYEDLLETATQVNGPVLNDNAPIAPALDDKDDCNFLFHHYNIDPRYKLIPKDVQYQICAELTDYFVGVFKLRPYRRSEEREPIWGCVLSNDDTKLAFCRDNHSSEFYNTTVECTIIDINGTKEPIRRISFLINHDISCSARLAFNASDSKILLQTTQELFEGDVDVDQPGIPRQLFASASLLEKFPGPSQISIYRATYALDGTLLISCDRKNLVIINYDPLEKKILSTVNIHPEFFACIQPTYASGVWFDNVSSRMLYIGGGGSAFSYNLATKEYGKLYSVNDDSESFICRSEVLEATDQNQKSVAVNLRCNKRVGHEEYVAIWDGDSGNCMGLFDLGKRIPFSLAVSKDSKYIIINSGDNVNPHEQPEPDMLELYHIPTRKRVGFQKKKSWHCGVGKGAAIRFTRKGDKFVTVIDSHDESVIEFFNMPQLLTDLQGTFAGRFTIEQYLLCIFLRELRQKNTTLNEYLPKLADSKGLDLKKTRKHITAIFLRSPLPIRRYFYFLITRSAIENEQ